MPSGSPTGSAGKHEYPGGRGISLLAGALTTGAIGLSIIAISLYVFTSSGGSFPIGPGRTAPAMVTSPSVTEQAAARRDFAERMYVEQLESHRVLDTMAKGDIRSIVVRGVQTGASAATLTIDASFADGTYGDGVMLLRRFAGSWYLFSLTGLRLRTSGGYSIAVEPATTVEASHTALEGLLAQRLSSFDEEIIAQLMAESTKSQRSLVGVLGGTYNRLDFGVPVVSADQAVEVPTTVTGPRGAHASGTVTLLRRELGGEERTFLTTMAIQ